MTAATAKKRLGEVLMDAGLITLPQLQEALERQKASHKKLGRVLVDMGLLGEMEICRALSTQLAIPLADLAVIGAGEREVLALVPRAVALKHNVLPVAVQDRNLTVVISDPLNLDALRDLEFITGKGISLLLAPESRLLGAVERAYDAGDIALKVMENVIPAESVEVVPEASGEDLDESKLVGGADAPPVVRLVSVVIADAVGSRASDIHLEAKEKETLIRYRVDGEMRTIMNIPAQLHQSVVTRIKVMSNLDISERRRPQDSRTKVKVAGQVVDLRISTLPSIYGERVVLRILETSKSLVPLDQLGFTPAGLALLRSLLANPQGSILITGPTGSGKTTLLYSALGEVKSDTRNIITLEDPVEYRLAGINQVQVNEKIGMTFAAGLRSILRQDPDVVMVGEIRDQETAEIAFRAAQTGHLVLATLHTNNAAATLSRLCDLGLPAYLVASSILGVVAQRLVRRICPDCREKERPDPARLAALGLPAVDVLYRGAGCRACNFSGYRGRMAVYEILVMDPEVRHMLAQKMDEGAMDELMRSKGIPRMFDDGWEKAREGLTTLDEVLGKVPRPADMLESAASAPLFPDLAGAIPGGGTDASPGSPGILLVHSDPGGYRLLAEGLRAAGHSCDIVPNGEEALRLLAGTRYSLVAMDSVLPGMGALGVLEEMRRRLATSRIPVILLGALPTPATRREAEKLGVVEVLEGELDAAVLCAAAGRALSRGEGAA
jgi:type IV pilus assembly protein PilB